MGNSMLQVLNLADNQLCGLDIYGDGEYTTEGITKLCKGLKGSAVTSLDLRYNNLGPKGGAAIAEGLKGNLTLQVLNLSCNELGPEGGAALAEGLKGNTTLQSLDLEDNYIKVEGAFALASVLKETMITNLNLGGNMLGPKGAAALLEGLKGNLMLQVLNLRGNNIEAEGASALAAILKETKITDFNLGYNDIGVEGASALAAVLKETMITNLKCAADMLANLLPTPLLPSSAVSTTTTSEPRELPRSPPS